MRIKSILIAPFLLVIFFSCKEAGHCSKEQVLKNQEAFHLAYQDWKEALNYMDADVIMPSNVLLDSSFVIFSNCRSIDFDLIAQADTISTIYANPNINRSDIKKAEKMMLTLDKNMAALSAK
ncbi:MAG: hypothetical protein KDD32_00030 [Bacteroidetes bacterium]|nr:hypothetical protein [Bacteroidota bacterium]